MVRILNKIIVICFVGISWAYPQTQPVFVTDGPVQPTLDDMETASTLIKMGYENMKIEKYLKALEWYTDAEVLIDSLHLPPALFSRSQIHQDKGVAYENLNDYKNALREYKKAYEIKPKNIFHQYNYAYGLAINDTSLQEALKLVNNVISQIPELYQAFYCRGIIFDKLGRVSEAIKEIETALDLCTEAKHEKMYINTLEAVRKKFK